MRTSRVPFPLAAALVVLFAVPDLLAQARDVDVLLYMAAAARANAEGALPYVAAWIEKGPLAMAAFQAIGVAFGPYSFPALALLWIAFAISGAWLARALAREAGATWADGWAALLFAASIGSVGGTLNTEVFAMVPAAWALLLWLRAARGTFAAGLLIGCAFLCRQNAGALWPLLAAVELGLAATGRRGGAEAARGAARLTAGFLVPGALVVAVYAAAGALEPFLFCFAGYNATIYVAATKVTAGRIVRIPWDVVVHFLWPVRTAAFLAIAGTAALLGGSRRGLTGVTLAASGAALLAAMVPGLRFFSHYAALALPVVAALGAIGLEALASRAARRAGIALALVAFSLGLELAPRGWIDAAGRLRAWVGRGDYARLGDPLAWPGRDEGMVEAAAFLRERGGADDRVFVWGMRPHVPVYASRVPATRFVTCTFLTGLVPWERAAPEDDTTRWIVPGAWEALEADLARERPAWIVDASHDHLFADGAYAPERFPRLQAILDRDYERALETGERDRLVVWRRRRAVTVR